jgi:hypothetical protein
MEQPIKLRVLHRYLGQEARHFGGDAVPEGAKIFVDARRARELITRGLAAPIVGPSETKPTGFGEKKAPSGTDGPAAPLSSSPVAPASPQTTAPKSLAAKARAAGASLLSRTTTGSSRRRTPSTDATRTSGMPGGQGAGHTSTK